MTKKTEEKLLEIAMKNSVEMRERGDFETRNSDQDDFLEVSIWGLKAMLEEAFEAGRKASRKK